MSDYTVLKKVSIVRFGDEMLWWDTSDSELRRKGHIAPREIPADEQARYEAALAAYKVLGEYEHTEWGGPDYGTEVPPPPATRWVFDETEEEYQARIKALKEGRA